MMPFCFLFFGVAFIAISSDNDISVFGFLVVFERYFLMHVATSHKVENISVYTILLFASYGNNSQS